MIQEKQIGDGSATVSYGDGERPKYRALANAIDGMYRDMLRPLAELRETVFLMLGLEEEQKQAPSSEEKGAACPSDLLCGSLYADRLGVSILTPRGCNGRQFGKAEEQSFRYLARQKRVIDQAIDLFLTEMAGPDRTREGYVSGGLESDTPDGVLQQRSVFGHAIGVQRASQVVGAGSTVTSGRQSPAVKAMLDNEFTRLSENGKLRLERVRDEIHGILTSATDAGIGPLDTARQLSKQFDQYKRFEFERLARTESAFAAIEGSKEQYREFGATQMRWLLSSGACPICTAYENVTVDIDDVANHPPGHPNCVCDLVPVGVEE